MTAPQRPYMPGYGIETSPEGLLDWAWAVQRLSTSHNYWLATADPDGPHLAGVWAVWFDDQLCFSTGSRSRKARNLAADPRCSLSCESAVESVVVRGRARRVVDPDELIRLVTAYADKYGDGVPPGEPVFVVRPDTVIALIESGGQFTRTATRWRPSAVDGA
jgi:nitroimidazol reductase NimA-like FMN-containing flavoprotein (pyridoxamine 5'-phosphate oxidase superfamily)